MEKTTGSFARAAVGMVKCPHFGFGSQDSTAAMTILIAGTRAFGALGVAE